MADNVLGLFFEISADPSKATQALSLFRSASERESQAVAGHFSTLQGAAEKARGVHETAFGQMTRSVQGFGDATTKVFASIAESVLRNIELDQLEVTQKGQTEASKLLISKQGIQQLAAVRTVQEFAEGLSALGQFDFWSAAQHFASSALYGTLAALQISSLVAAGGGGGGVSGPTQASAAVGGGSAASSAPVPFASGSASP